MGISYQLCTRLPKYHFTFGEVPSASSAKLNAQDAFDDDNNDRVERKGCDDDAIPCAHKMHYGLT